MSGDGLADFILEAAGWSQLNALEPRCRAALAAAAERAGDVRTGAAAVLFADDETVQELNERFRGKDRATNVLSFPAPEAEPYPGDIVLAYETCKAEAEQRGIALIDHAAHLVVHGFLHLNGYDHQEEEDAQVMERLESEALSAVGIADPYAD
ncbi:MAG: rRNA maturation RNase YbeY [Pseudomonadota bacterium]